MTADTGLLSTDTYGDAIAESGQVPCLPFFQD
jgi:hypothetical protein